MNKELNLRANEVAELDPYGVRKKPIQGAAKELLREDEERERIESFILEREKIQWEKVLGITPEIPLLPHFLNNERINNLETNNFHLVYMPKLDLYHSELHTYKNAIDYLAYLENRYPNWLNPESLSDSHKSDPNISKNLGRQFWTDVENGAIAFPELPGKWMAVEDRNHSKILEVLGERHGQSWEEVNKKLMYYDGGEYDQILSELGLFGYGIYMRFPEAIELNLLDNRFGWGRERDWIWTNTSHGLDERIAMGDYQQHTKKEYMPIHKKNDRNSVGFQLVLDFEPENYI